MKPSTITSATWSKLWLFKQNQIPAIGAWLNKHSGKFVMATCLVAGGFVIGQIASESEMVSRANDIHIASFASGQNAGCVAQKEELVKQVTVQRCMGWLFNDDPLRVGKALQAGRLQ